MQGQGKGSKPTEHGLCSAAKAQHTGRLLRSRSKEDFYSKKRGDRLRYSHLLGNCTVNVRREGSV